VRTGCARSVNHYEIVAGGGGMWDRIQEASSMWLQATEVRMIKQYRKNQKQVQHLEAVLNVLTQSCWGSVGVCEQSVRLRIPSLSWTN
jgi:hypothetical protein